MSRSTHVRLALRRSIAELRELLDGHLTADHAEPIRAIARRLAGAASVLDEPTFVRPVEEPARDPP